MADEKVAAFLAVRRRKRDKETIVREALRGDIENRLSAVEHAVIDIAGALEGIASHNAELARAIVSGVSDAERAVEDVIKNHGSKP